MISRNHSIFKLGNKLFDKKFLFNVLKCQNHHDTTSHSAIFSIDPSEGFKSFFINFN